MCPPCLSPRPAMSARCSSQKRVCTVVGRWMLSHRNPGSGMEGDTSVSATDDPTSQPTARAQYAQRQRSGPVYDSSDFSDLASMADSISMDGNDVCLFFLGGTLKRALSCQLQKAGPPMKPAAERDTSFLTTVASTSHLPVAARWSGGELENWLLRPGLGSPRLPAMAVPSQARRSPEARCRCHGHLGGGGLPLHVYAAVPDACPKGGR